MAETGLRFIETFVASNDLTTALWQHKFVDISSAGTVIPPTADGDTGLGIVEIGGLAGEAMSVTVFGLTKIRGGSALYGGQKITSALSGFAIVTASGNTALGMVVGNCASGDLVEALIYPAGGQVVA